jgi:hypothetical protein
MAKVVSFHEAMDKLWTDHIAWTRAVIVDFEGNLPDLQPDLGRLLANQAEIGAAIKPYYGNAAGNSLAALLHTHIMEAVPVLTYARDGNKGEADRSARGVARERAPDRRIPRRGQPEGVAARRHDLDHGPASR